MISKIDEPLRTQVLMRFIDSIVIDKKTGCWLWRGGKRFFGYGAFFIRRPDAKTVAAHR